MEGGWDETDERPTPVPPPEEAPLDALAEAAAAGDRSAWARVWVELSGRVHSYLRLAGASDPDGMTSDVFVALIGRDSGLRGGWEGLRSLVFSIAHARLVDDRRRAHVRRGTTPYDPEADPRTTPSAEASVLASLGETEVVGLLALLPEGERTVLALRYVADLDLAQTAAVIGRSPATASRLQAKALRTLRTFLEPTTTPDTTQRGTP